MSFLHAQRKFSQHFLQDTAAAQRIVSHLSGYGGYKEVLEIGPGLGALTAPLLATSYRIHAVEIDPRAVEQLQKRFGERLQLYSGDILKMDFGKYVQGPLAVVGNLPYAISSAIFFKLLEARDQVPEALFLVQEEVAQRLSTGPGSRRYGLLSVLLQAYYQIKYCLGLAPAAFSPRPKVDSGLLRLQRRSERALGCSHEAFVHVVKLAFAQRRKMLRNTLAPLGVKVPAPYADQRAEALSVADFVAIAQLLPQTFHT